MFWLWLFIAIILFAVSMYLLGRYAADEPDANSLMWVASFGSILWPVVLTAAVIFGPFFGLYFLGTKRAEKAKEKSGK